MIERELLKIIVKLLDRRDLVESLHDELYREVEELREKYEN